MFGLMITFFWVTGVLLCWFTIALFAFRFIRKVIHTPKSEVPLAFFMTILSWPILLPGCIVVHIANELRLGDRIDEFTRPKDRRSK